MDRPLIHKLLLLLAVVFLVLATLTVAGVWVVALWTLPAGLAAWALSILVLEL